MAPGKSTPEAKGGGPDSAPISPSACSPLEIRQTVADGDHKLPVFTYGTAMANGRGEEQQRERTQWNPDAQEGKKLRQLSSLSFADIVEPLRVYQVWPGKNFRKMAEMGFVRLTSQSYMFPLPTRWRTLSPGVYIFKPGNEQTSFFLLEALSLILERPGPNIMCSSLEGVWCVVRTQGASSSPALPSVSQTGSSVPMLEMALSSHFLSY
ncbi:hypothetical protein EJ110_NYTH11264 [Nymphaea thermarum]|nr:hypothetical protein EJ110_NYTH11264 [Nymphaea thermarum]